MKKIKVGDTISAVLFGGTRVQGKIEQIEICKSGEKYGRVVNSCNLDEQKDGVLDLDCGHWCYFNQIQCIIRKKE